MVSKLRPLDVTVDFAGRTYKLGETIDVAVELRAKRDVEVREGRVDLVCEERWTENFWVKQYSGAWGGITVGTVPKVDLKEHTETYASSSFRFLQDSQLAAGRTEVHRARLEFPSEAPPHAADGTVKWTVVTTVDVVRGRDVRTRHAVKVDLGG